MKYEEIEVLSDGRVQHSDEYDEEGLLRVNFHGEPPEVLEVCVIDPESGDASYARLDLWKLISEAAISELREKAALHGYALVAES